MSNPEYTLEKTVVGKFEKIKKPESVILQDAEGNKLRAPWKPKTGCKRCCGRGFVGRNVETKELLPCRKCYPWK